MKKVFSFLLFFLVFNLNPIFGQINLESSDVDEMYYNSNYVAKVTIKLSNYTKEDIDKITITYGYSKPPGENFEEKQATLNASGIAYLDLDNLFPFQQIFIGVNMGKNEIYYSPILIHETLELVLNIASLKQSPFDINGVSFLGKDAGLNKFVYEYEAFKETGTYRQLWAGAFQLTNNQTLTLENKLKEVKTLYSKLNGFNQEFLKSQSNKYKWVVENEYQSEYYQLVLLSHLNEKNISISPKILKECLAHTPQLISEASISYYRYLGYLLQKMNSQQEDFVVATLRKEFGENAKEDLEQFITAYQNKNKGRTYQKKVYKKGKKQYLDKFQDLFYQKNLLEYKYSLSKIPIRKADLIKLMSVNPAIEHREKYLAFIIPTMQTQWCKAVLQQMQQEELRDNEKINKLLNQSTAMNTNTSLGKHLLSISNNINLYQANHQNINDLLNAIQNKYKGKTIIIDLWATWCGICISDMKKSTEIKKELKKLPVEIVYLCGDSSLEHWKTMTTKLTLSGEHILLNESLSAELLKLFNFQGYPNYLLIDSKGKYHTNPFDLISEIDVDDFKSIYLEK